MIWEDPLKFVDPTGLKQNLLQKVFTKVISFAASKSEKVASFVKSHTTIDIQRSQNDNGQNGKYFQSEESVKFCGIPLNSIDVQSTADWQSQVDAGNGGTIKAGTYSGALLNRSGSYNDAISITGNGISESDWVLCHPNVKTALGETEEYGQGASKGRPLGLGCQISHLKDFDETTKILKDVGFEYGKGDAPWLKGDNIKINIKDPVKGSN